MCSVVGSVVIGFEVGSSEAPTVGEVGSFVGNAVGLPVVLEVVVGLEVGTSVGFEVGANVVAKEGKLRYCRVSK